MAANDTHPRTAPVGSAWTVHGPNRHLGCVACMRHMMGDSNPFDLGGLADDATALTRVLRSLYMYDYSAARLSWISATFTDLG